MTYPASAPVRFGLFELDPRSGEMRRRGLTVRLTPQAKELLCLLVEAPIRTRTREEIQQRLWSSNTFVDFDQGVNKVVHSLREALGESARRPHFIETVAAKGYRFLPQYVEHSPAADPTHTSTGVEWLAVLPIATEPDAELVFLGKRITSCLIEELARMPGIRVMAESTVKSHKLEDYSPQQAGQSLGVRAILSGELTRNDSELFLQMEMIDSADGALLCGMQVERVSQPDLHCALDLARGIINQIEMPGNPSPEIKKPPRSVQVLERRMLERRANAS